MVAGCTKCSSMDGDMSDMEQDLFRLRSIQENSKTSVRGHIQGREEEWKGDTHRPVTHVPGKTKGTTFTSHVIQRRIRMPTDCERFNTTLLHDNFFLVLNNNGHVLKWQISIILTTISAQSSVSM